MASVMTITSVRNHLNQMISRAERLHQPDDLMTLKVCRDCLDDCILLTQAEQHRQEANLEVEAAYERLFNPERYGA